MREYGHGLRGWAPIVVLCMPRAPRQRSRGDRALPQPPAVSIHWPLSDSGVRGPPGMDALRNGIAATARSASMPRLTGLPQFHPEDAARRRTPNRHRGRTAGSRGRYRRRPARHRTAVPATPPWRRGRRCGARRTRTGWRGPRARSAEDQHGVLAREAVEPGELAEEQPRLQYTGNKARKVDTRTP